MNKASLHRNDEQKVQTFILMTSKSTKQNMIPFSDKWGLSATGDTKSEIEKMNLPLLTTELGKIAIMTIASSLICE